MKKFRSIIFTIIAVLALFISGAAFAAEGDVFGLADFNTISTARFNTYSAYLEEGDFHELLIVRLVENEYGIVVPDGFPTEEEALSLVWSQNTPGMYNLDINDSYFEAVSSPVGSGFALYMGAIDYATTLGPDSWRATDGDGNTGDFTFVATDPSAADYGSVNNIGIELYDEDPTVSADLFAARTFVNPVLGIDDRTFTGDLDRSYPTPLDAVARGTISPDKAITTYHKYPLSQTIWDIVDTTPPDGITHTPTGEEGWVYAVYYLDPDNPDPDPLTGLYTYKLDDNSLIIGYDDYMLQDGALVIFGITNDYAQLSSYFPNSIERPYALQ